MPGSPPTTKKHTPPFVAAWEQNEANTNRIEAILAKRKTKVLPIPNASSPIDESQMNTFSIPNTSMSLEEVKAAYDIIRQTWENSKGRRNLALAMRTVVLKENVDNCVLVGTGSLSANDIEDTPEDYENGDVDRGISQLAVFMSVAEEICKPDLP